MCRDFNIFQYTYAYQLNVIYLFFVALLRPNNQRSFVFHIYVEIFFLSFNFHKNTTMRRRLDAQNFRLCKKEKKLKLLEHKYTPGWKSQLFSSEYNTLIEIVPPDKIHYTFRTYLFYISLSIELND